jgi:hypothetical protein
MNGHLGVVDKLSEYGAKVNTENRVGIFQQVIHYITYV